MSARQTLEKRLTGYWKMEVGNAVLLPVCMALIALMLDSMLGLLSWLTFVPMCLLLVLGGLYWRGKLHALQGSKTSLHTALAIADKAQGPLLVLSSAAIVAALAAWIVPAMSVSLADRICASVAAALAGLEYVNYYHRQLQHFDHAEDWQRLVSGRGFRPAQMAVDLRRFREAR